ncbi:hypothetical protein [Nonomuraea wenchangensis]|uniref:hypothetical protein n=1 Tax=Nonomuraea wenchangensis TaxID=568860 RepID=UPI0037A37B7F
MQSGHGAAHPSADATQPGYGTAQPDPGAAHFGHFGFDQPHYGLNQPHPGATQSGPAAQPHSGYGRSAHSGANPYPAPSQAPGAPQHPLTVPYPAQQPSGPQPTSGPHTSHPPAMEQAPGAQTAYSQVSGPQPVPPHPASPHTASPYGGSPDAASPQAPGPQPGQPTADTPWVGPLQPDLQGVIGRLPAEGAPWPSPAPQQPAAQDLPSWPVDPAVPGAPPWEPPPAFTAAAAGMPVWPAPPSDPHAMPPWPAATGELVAEPDEPQPTAFAADVTDPEGIVRPPHHVAAPTPDQPQQPGHPQNPNHPQGPSHVQGLSDPQGPSGPHPVQRPAGLSQPATGGNTAFPATAPGVSTPGPGAPVPGQNASAPGDDPRQEGGAPTDPDATRPGTVPVPSEGPRPHPSGDARQSGGHAMPLAAPVAEAEETRPAPAHQLPAITTSGAPAESQDADTPHDDQPPATPFDPNAPTPVRPAEPGDVPVWPPLPPGAPGATGTTAPQRIPDLPFSRDTWGQRQSTSLDLPTPPHGLATTAAGKGAPGGPAFPPGAFKQAPFQIPPPPPPPSGGGKRALLVTLGALALVGVATGGFFAYQAVSDPAPTTAAARTAPPSGPDGQGQGQGQGQPQQTALTSEDPGASVLDSEQSDPQKLSLSEAFPKKKVSAAGTTFKRVKAGMETTCDKAAVGAFADALKAQSCTRVLRATYVDSKKRYAVTTGIAVLPTRDAATTVDQSKDLGKNIWFRPLPGPEGSGGDRVQIAGGYAAGLVWGRYIVFSYATYADGRTPTDKEKTLPKVSGAFRDQTSLVLERRVTGG